MIHTLRFVGVGRHHCVKRCVCGHPRPAHLRTSMSVELKPNPTPLYPTTNTQIAKFSPTATYDCEECHCGCTIFEAA